MSGLALGLGLPAGQGAVRDPDAAAVIAAMTTPPPETRKGQIDAFVRALKGCGVWQKLDSLFVFAAHHEQAARVDWKSPSRVATPQGGPAFVTDRGFEFDGVASYLATGFVPSMHCTQGAGTAGSVGIYERTNVAIAAVAAGASMSSTRNVAINPRATSDICAGQWNHSATGFSAISTDSRGLWVAQRDGGTTSYYYRGSLMETKSLGSNGSALVAVQMHVGCNNANGVAGAFRANSVSAFFVGGVMNVTEQAELYGALQSYLIALSAAV